MIQRMLLNAVIELQGILQSLSVACGPHIFRQAVEGKADGIELLAGVQGLTFVVQAPKDTTILLVDEMLDEVIFGIGCRLQILRLLQHTIGSRERPEDTGIEDGTLLCIRMEHLMTINTSIEPSVLTVYHLCLPERQDVVFQDILHFQLHHIQALVHFLIG